jgi:hypothetical protein
MKLIEKRILLVSYGVLANERAFATLNPTTEQ